MKEGTIKSLSEKGFGFITVKGEKNNIFFHAKDLLNARFDELEEGARVSIGGIDSNEKGKYALEISLME